MLRIGLTGSIATGKSTVLRMFGALGIPTFSSDDAVHRLYEGAAAGPIGALFPGVVVEGAVDRSALAVRLIEHPERLRELEAVVHPLVRSEIAEFFAAAESRGEPLAVADIPLLFEGGFDYGLDAVVVTTVDAAAQRRRALSRPGMTVEKLEAILARQMPQAEKKRRATHVISTSGSLESTENAIKSLVDVLGAKQQAQ